MAAVAPVLLPEMKKRGNHEGELISLLAASGAMAETAPPSLVLITIGSVAGISIAGSSAINRLARSARALAPFASYADPLLSHTEIVSWGPESRSDLGKAETS
jgi:hypothetical protein